eukprot:2031227-Amphidinium_carterae.1
MGGHVEFDGQNAHLTEKVLLSSRSHLHLLSFGQVPPAQYCVTIRSGFSASTTPKQVTKLG